MEIRAVIIDDDPFIHEHLTDELKFHAPEVSIVGRGSNGFEGLKAIKTYQPELIFLDVEMPDMTGFDVLRNLEDPDLQVIFVTSHDYYAIKAIKFNALDYLIKPVDEAELKIAIERYKTHAVTQGMLQNAIKNLKTEDPAEQSLLLNSQEGEVRIKLKDIVRIEALSNYSQVITTAGRRVLTSKTLGALEEMLDDSLFFRCHKSHLVNSSNIASFEKGILITSDGVVIPISRRKMNQFKEWVLFT